MPGGGQELAAVHSADLRAAGLLDTLLVVPSDAAVLRLPGACASALFYVGSPASDAAVARQLRGVRALHVRGPCAGAVVAAVAPFAPRLEAVRLALGRC